jgi:hypothetical protein
MGDSNHGSVMNIDDLNTDTISVAESEFDQIVDMLGVGGEITAKKLRVETENGKALHITSHEGILIYEEDS